MINLFLSVFNYFQFPLAVSTVSLLPFHLVFFQVMMGGHWFNSLFGHPDSVDPNHLQDVAIETAEKTLGIRTKPTSCLTTIQRDCIPQYTLGHSDRIKNIFDFIEQRKLPLSLIGASYNGVSMNDCIYNAQLTVDRILESN